MWQILADTCRLQTSSKRPIDARKPLAFTGPFDGRIFTSTSDFHDLLLSLRSYHSLLLLRGFRYMSLPGTNFTNIWWAAFSYKKSLEQHFCTYIVGLYFLGARKLAQKLLVKCWCNWLQEAAGLILLSCLMSMIVYAFSNLSQKFVYQVRYWV